VDHSFYSWARHNRSTAMTGNVVQPPPQSQPASLTRSSELFPLSWNSFRISGPTVKHWSKMPAALGFESPNDGLESCFGTRPGSPGTRIPRHQACVLPIPLRTRPSTLRPLDPVMVTARVLRSQLTSTPWTHLWKPRATGEKSYVWEAFSHLQHNRTKRPARRGAPDSLTPGI